MVLIAAKQESPSPCSSWLRFASAGHFRALLCQSCSPPRGAMPMLCNSIRCYAIPLRGYAIPLRCLTQPCLCISLLRCAIPCFSNALPRLSAPFHCVSFSHSAGHCTASPRLFIAPLRIVLLCLFSSEQCSAKCCLSFSMLCLNVSLRCFAVPLLCISTHFHCSAHQLVALPFHCFAWQRVAILSAVSPCPASALPPVAM